MTNTEPSLRSDDCPICSGIGVRQLSESVSAFIGIRSESPLEQTMSGRIMKLLVELLFQPAEGRLARLGGHRRVVPGESGLLLPIRDGGSFPGHKSIKGSTEEYTRSSEFFQRISLLTKLLAHGK